MTTAALPPALTATAAAVLCWPRNTTNPRLQALTRNPHTTRTWRIPNPPALIAAAALLALLTFGPGPAIAITIGGITLRSQWRARNQTRNRIAAAESIADAIQGLVAELKAGAHPVAAAESAAQDAARPANEVLIAIATTARMDGDLTSVLDRFTTNTPTPVPALRPLINAWTLAQRHGLPLADVLAAVQADVAGRIRFAHKVKARMAGPQASGVVLAALPALGVLLGETMGANPLHVLLANPLGQTLLATGTTLICLGIHWTTRLTTQAVLP